MKKEDILKKEKKRIWCPGCGLFAVEKIISEEIEKMGWDRKNTVIVSGIGCSARISEYFNLDSMHVTHGRTIPVAEGIKLANPDINVVIISGDGDLVSIGGNHLLHAIERNSNIKVFCNNNRVYAMTGGQSSATTPKNEKTKTDPEGRRIEGIDLKRFFEKKDGVFFEKTDALNIEDFRKKVKISLKSKNFSFLDIVSPCVAHSRRKGFGF
jgi:2-oxoglutarate/2-oxoacid ferredoxin oxidoreductase subunit beta